MQNLIQETQTYVHAHLLKEITGLQGLSTEYISVRTEYISVRTEQCAHTHRSAESSLKSTWCKQLKSGYT